MPQPSSEQIAGSNNEAFEKLREAIGKRSARVGIVGLGYVGLPLAVTAANAGFPVLGFDIDANRVTRINAGETMIKHIDGALIKDAIDKGSSKPRPIFRGWTKPTPSSSACRRR
jgi:UDP-N-acetyl-D-glucosamine dehydrogenase